MKSYKIFLIILIGLFPLLDSCSNFLNQPPTSSLTAEQVFSSEKNLDPLIVGLYTQWRNTRKDRGGFYFMMGTDEARQGFVQVRDDPNQAALDRYDAFLIPSNTAVTSQWTNRWPIVSSAAQAIQALLKVSNPSDRQKELLGEASFIRAAVCFEITQYWGAIPILDYDKIDQYGTARQPLKDVYTFIESDLQRAMQYLPSTQTDARRATKWAAEALLGKLYLYADANSGFRDYQKASNAFLDIINSQQFGLATNFSTLFDPAQQGSGDYNKEIIYAFQFGNIQPDQNQCQWQMGSRAVAIMTNPNAILWFAGYDLMMPTDYCYQTVDSGGIWEAGDLRRAESIRFDFKYTGSVPVINGGIPQLTGYCGGDELDPHVKKYEDKRTDGWGSSPWYSGKNIPYIRYADVVLCYAECQNELGNITPALSYANLVRRRAFGDATHNWKALSQDQFRTMILDERMRELCFEGWRHMDLVRTGNFVNYIKERNKWAKASGTIDKHNTVYPIPRSEILQNPDIPVSAQNPGYPDQ